MDEATPPDPPAEAPPDQAWSPSLELHGLLLTGVWAVVLAACLSAASSLLAMSRGPQPGVTASPRHASAQCSHSWAQRTHSSVHGCNC